MATASDPTLLVLASLTDGDKHGYAIMTDVREFAGVEMGPGTLYGAITRLEQQGLIRGLAPVDRRRPYRLMAAGRAYLEEQLAAFEAVRKVAARRLRQA